MNNRNQVLMEKKNASNTYTEAITDLINSLYASVNLPKYNKRTNDYILLLEDLATAINETHKISQGGNGDGTSPIITSSWHYSETELTEGEFIPSDTSIYDFFLDCKGNIFNVVDSKYHLILTLNNLIEHKVGIIKSGSTPNAEFRKEDNRIYLDITFPNIPKYDIWEGDMILSTSEWNSKDSSEKFVQEVSIESVTLDNTIEITDGTDITIDMIKELNECNVRAMEQKEKVLIFYATKIPSIDIQLHIKTTTLIKEEI